MGILKILWTNNKVSLSVSGSDTVETFVVEDNIKYAIDKNEIFDKISNAVKSLGYQGFHAHMFYEGKNIEHESMPSSPEITKRKDVLELIKYKISSKAIIPNFESYMYSYTLSEPNDKERFILIDFFNIEFIQCLIYAFDKLGISLDHLSSMCPVLSNIAKDIKYEKPFFVNYITDFGTTDFVFYCNNKNGITSFMRYTPPYIDIEDIKSSISGSSMYGKQLFSGVIPDIYLVGDQAVKIIDDLNVDKELNLLGDDRIVWDAINVNPNNLTSNVIPQSERGKKEQKSRVNIAGIIVGIIFIISLGFYFITKDYAKTKEIESSRYLQYSDDLSKKIKEFGSIEKDKNKNDYILSSYSDYTLRVLSGISNLLKEDMILSNFSSSRDKLDNGNYVVSYEMTGLIYSDPITAAESLAVMEKSMSEQPFNAIITKSWKSNWLNNIEKWKSAKGKRSSTSDTTGISFEISGKVYE